MVAIRIFIVLELGGANIKNNKPAKPPKGSTTSEAVEQTHKQALKADEEALWSIYNSLASCVPFYFCPFRLPFFKQTDPSDTPPNSDEPFKRTK